MQVVVERYRKFVWAAVALAFCVIVLGAYVRLSDAGLGCPDWPGCYGHLGAPESASAQASAHLAFPGRVIETAKAWKEMVHRYLAGTLGLLIVGIAVTAWRKRQALRQSPALPALIILLLALQAALGMWTVTLLLKPAIVTSHLAGGLTTLSLLLVIALRQGGWRPPAGFTAGAGLRRFALLALVVVAAQILLGGWTSTNYAALACQDFPTCQGSYLPPMDFSQGFHVTRELGMRSDGGLLGMTALTAIHWTHRVGALAVFLVVGALSLCLARQRAARPYAAALGALLVAQIALGVSNVLFSLPLPVAVAHNAGAALLLSAMVLVNIRLSQAKRHQEG